MPTTWKEAEVKMYDRRARDRRGGCQWLMLIPLIALSLAMLACGVVRKVAEPIDRLPCELDCRRVGLEVSRYVYETDVCWCALPNGSEVPAHEFFEEP